MKALVVLAVVAVAILAGCTASESNSATSGTVTAQSVSGGSGGTGGTVKDVRGSISSFTADKSTGDNSGSTVVTFSGTANDGNGEQDIAFIATTSTGAGVLGANHTVTPAERAATTEPSTFGGDGFKVWNPTAKDGALSFKWSLTINAFQLAGNYTFTSTEGNAASVTSLASTGVAFQVTSFSSITVASAPVDSTGAAQTGASWGGWQANPGDTNVPAVNYIKLTNTGDIANSAVVIDFTETAFTGPDTNYTVPIDSHIQFAFCDTTSGNAPSSCTFTYGTTSPSGSTTVTFAGKGHVIYVAYRMTDLPTVLAAQSYGAHFTVTEL